MDALSIWNRLARGCGTIDGGSNVAVLQKNVEEFSGDGAKGYFSKNASVSNLVKAIHTVHHGELCVERSLIARFFEGEDFADVNGEDPHKSTQEGLTKRKQEILRLLASGGTHTDIAQT